MSLAELLVRFPDDPEIVPSGLSVVKAAELSIAAAWHNVRKTWQAPEEPQPEDDDAALWDWLWQGVSFDIVSVAESADLPVDIVSDKLLMLARLRLIWPDGQMSSWLRKIEAAELTKKPVDLRPTTGA